ncbi:MAG: CotH kinase family protein, partial [Oscillospiraceae bacterium]|nr:CotH kinase family protein [Oscillospiraceae bacterium]
MKKSLFVLVFTLFVGIFAFSANMSSADEKKPYLCGDINQNGVTDISDALEILRYLAKLPSEVKYDATISDALEILRYLAKIPSTISRDGCSCPMCATTTTSVTTTTSATTTSATTTSATASATETEKVPLPDFKDLPGYSPTRFSADTLIFTIDGDEDDLFGHENGILVEGIDRQKWIEEFTRKNGRPPRPGPSWEGGEIEPNIPANFNRTGRESEREVYVRVFDSTGKLLISQDAGVRVKGGYSRAHPQKSLELYARDEYGKSTFAFPFFGDENSCDGNIMNKYKRIRLRNGGSDRFSGNIRDELSQSLFRQAGHLITQNHTPAAVFLNGEYYGVAWLKSPRTENHLRRKLGGETDNYEIISGGDNRLTDSWWLGEKRATDDINEVFQIAKMGFTGTQGQVRFEEFCKRVDLDSLVRYYAM